MPCSSAHAGAGARDEERHDRVRSDPGVSCPLSSNLSFTPLRGASNDPGVDDATRGLALWNIYYQRRDAKTLALMRKYEKSPNKEVAKRAGIDLLAKHGKGAGVTSP